MASRPPPLAGRLRHQITIRRPVNVSDGKGGYRRGWTTIAETWAEVTGQNGREAVIANALQGISAYRVIIRFRSGIQTNDQILYGAEELNIRSVSDPDGRREALYILADTSSPQHAGVTS